MPASLTNARILAEIQEIRGTFEALNAYIESLNAFYAKTTDGGIALGNLNTDEWTSIGLEGQDPGEFTQCLTDLKAYADNSIYYRTKFAK